MKGIDRIREWMNRFFAGITGGRAAAAEGQSAPEPNSQAEPAADAVPEEVPASSEETDVPVQESQPEGDVPLLSRQERHFFRLAIILLLSLLFIMVFAFFVTFLVSLRGKERTMVPDLGRMELVQGLMDLQEKELYPRVQVRFSSSPADKGRIIDQDPSPGTVVKAGKRVTLVVSKGAIVNRVENYVGRELSQVRMDIQALFTSQTPLLKIQDPVVYIYDDTPAGTILEQKPEPGTEISGLTDLELWVSRGSKGDTITVDQFIGMDYRKALAALVRNRMIFTFDVTQASDKVPGTIVSQSPAPKVEMDRGERIKLIMTPPEDLEEDEVFGLFEYSLQDYPVSVDMRLESVSVSGVTETLIGMKHPGGRISIPYVQPAGRELVLYVYDKEVLRMTVEAPEEEEG